MFQFHCLRVACRAGIKAMSSLPRANNRVAIPRPCLAKKKERQNVILPEYSGISARKTEAFYQAPSIASPPLNLPYVKSMTTLTLTINNKKLPFPLPDAQGLTPFTQWLQGADSVRAPFLNRTNILCDMLTAAFLNWVGKVPKAPYSVQIVHRGSGKTRLQTEWIFHALNNTDVVQRFLDEPTVQHSTDSKKQFMNVLYEAAYKGRMILVTGQQLPNSEAIASEVLKYMVVSHITSRFKGCKVELNGRVVSVTSLNKRLKDLDLETHFTVFNLLVDKYCVPPEFLPYPGYELGQRKLVLLGLDECQLYSADGVDRETDKIYQLLNETGAGLHNWTNFGVYWLVTGTSVQRQFVERHASSFVLTKASMESLLCAEYLNGISKHYFGKELLFRPNTQDKQLYLEHRTAKALIGLFYRTLGVPRAIEILIRNSYTTFKQMDELYQKSKGLTRVQFMVAREQVRKDYASTVQSFHEELEMFYNASELTRAIKLAVAKHKARAQRALELLDIKAALCLPQLTDVPIEHLNTTPRVLEREAYLIQWHKVNEDTKCYTRPFLFSLENVNKELQTLAYQGLPSKHWTPLKIAPSTLILHADLAHHLDDGLTVGALLEEVTAASLYARYVLAREVIVDSPVCLADLFTEADIEEFPEELKKAHVHWNGVAKATVKVNSNRLDFFNEVHEHGVVIIDNMQSPFADVILPILITRDGIVKKAFIGIQAKHRLEVLPHQLANNALNILSNADFYYIVLAPSPPTSESMREAILQRQCTVELSRTTKQLREAANKIEQHNNETQQRMQYYFDTKKQQIQIELKEVAAKITHELATGINAVDNILKELVPTDEAALEAAKKKIPVEGRVFCLKAATVVSPVFQAYFGFLHLFEEK